MEDDAPHFSPKHVGVVSIETYEGAAVEGDLVRERATVVAAAPGERYALVEPEQRLSRGRFVFDHDFDVRHVSAEIRRQRVDGVLCVLFEPLYRIEAIVCHSASKSGAATNTESRLYSSVVLSVFSCRPNEQAEDDHCGHEHQQYENDRDRNVHTDILAAATRREQCSCRSMYALAMGAKLCVSF
jgi:hypothetical protein